MFSHSHSVPPEVLDDGLGLGLTPDDGVLLGRAAGFVLDGEHSAHVPVGAQRNDARLLPDERQVGVKKVSPLHFSNRFTAAHSQKKFQ